MSWRTLLGLLQEGRPVHTGIAIYTPSITLEGDIEIKVRLSQRLLNDMNVFSNFQGEIFNANNIGKTSDELITEWNNLHPTNQVE
ncbi:MAG: hypothetical protein NT121_07485 [Chloroflexi bacterium]|nr:hypothetical protein [Chloroflexota bacterium]